MNVGFSKFTYGSVLSVCGKTGDLELGRVVHGMIVVSGVGVDVDAFLSNLLVGMYSKCGRVDIARVVFEKCGELDEVSWSSMIAGYVKGGLYDEMLRVLVKMHRCGVGFSSYVLGSVLYACCRSFGDLLIWGKLLHSCSVKLGWDLDVVVGTVLLDISCIAYKDLEYGKQIHAHVCKNNLQSDEYIGSALIDMYSLWGLMTDSIRCFNSTKKQDIVIWTSAIVGHAQNGEYERALVIFCELLKNELKPDEFTVSTVLSACANLGGVRCGEQIQNYSVKSGIVKSSVVVNSLVYMYAKSGDIDSANQAFDLADKSDVVSWSVMICSTAHHGCAKEALTLFDLMIMETLAVTLGLLTFTVSAPVRVMKKLEIRYDGFDISGRKDFQVVLLDLLSDKDNVAALLVEKFVSILLGRSKGRSLNLNLEVVAEAFMSVEDPLVIVCSGYLRRIHGVDTSSHSVNVGTTLEPPSRVNSNLNANPVNICKAEGKMKENSLKEMSESTNGEKGDLQSTFPSESTTEKVNIVNQCAFRPVDQREKTNGRVRVQQQQQNEVAIQNSAHALEHVVFEKVIECMDNIYAIEGGAEHEKKNTKWKVKTLSIGGRLTLLKSVLGASPIYYMSIFKVPKGVLKTMESIRSKFFNGVDSSDRKISWVAWDNVLASKLNGGLGVSSFFVLNRALLLKWVWRFISGDGSLWCKVIQAIYGSKFDLHVTDQPSIWCSILREVKSLKDSGFDFSSHCKKRIGDGSCTSFWYDIWLADAPLCVQFPRLFALELDKEIVVANKMGASSVSASFRRDVRDGAERQQWDDLSSIMNSVVLSSSKDRWTCDLSGDGEFKVKVIRNFIDDLFLPSSDVATRWVKFIPIKVNVFSWRARRDRLPTRVNLSRRGVLLDSHLCPLCNAAMEDVQHVFFRCDVARVVLRKICRWWDLDWQEICSFSDWDAWFLSFRLSSRLKSILEGVFYVAWWRIWRLRNQLVFDASPPNRSTIFDDISKKQTVVATSITEAKYVAAASKACGIPDVECFTFEVMVEKKVNDLDSQFLTFIHGLCINMDSHEFPHVYLVGDEAVHKELVVKMENSFTTASSLEAEHDSGLSFPSKQSTRIHLYQEVPLGSRAGHVMETYWNDGDFCYKTVNGREGTDCLPIATIFEELARMSAWNEISSSMASLILMLQIRSFHLSKFLIYNKAKDASSIRRLCFEKRIQRSGRSLGRSLGAPEDASKQGRSIADIDADNDVTLVDETQERQDDDLMFDTRVLDDDEMPVEAKVDGKDEQSTKPDDSTAGEAVTTASVDDSVVPITIEEITLAQTLIQIKAAKPKVVTTAATTTNSRV
ncbi:RNA-directed DNA polymerase, eukaryota [Tanacetum coccineum]|uniref:RNA-directed DNA polymerase, eukaryota n=1 Tax=Tanacetum coccineum TaxID=301880 RepID=A0ABQ5IIQ6_9ASTR